MKRRIDIAAGEVIELHDRIDRLLDRAGLETQPKVAMRLLELVGSDSAQLRQYGDIIRLDAALSGRLLRLANSAYFAQRAPVTKLERALVLLGIERVKAVSLGFTLMRATATPESRAIARQAWGQSVFRACLASALAKVRCVPVASEGFVVGLMLDCGIPLMSRLIGPEYEALFARATTPAKLYAAEMRELEFTHVDVAAVLLRRWRIPPLLAKPIVWHHTPPPGVPATAGVDAADLSGSAPRATVLGRAGGGGGPVDPMAVLQRAAFFAGAVTLTADGLPADAAPLSSLGARVMEMSQDQLGDAIRSATREYAATAQVFSDAADQIRDLDSLAEAVQRQLIDVIDEQMSRAILQETQTGPTRLSIAGYEIELKPADDGTVVLFLDTPSGERLLTCRLNPAAETLATLHRSLGLDEATEDELRQLAAEVKRLAA